jgi:L-ascorbate metabolism protein UlaG (beta-lactamase superfamily)
MAITSNATLMAMTYIGGPTLLLELGGLRLMTDPTFDRAGTRYDRLHKLIGPAIRADRVGAVDAVLLSHDQHPDNLDTSGRSFLSQCGTVLTTTTGAQRLGGNAKGLAPWETTQLNRPDGGTIQITATPARHGPPGCESYMGDVTGFVISWSEQPRSAIYISGDTVFYEEFTEIAERFSIGIAILHFGDAHVDGRSAHRLTMNAEEGIKAAQTLRPHTMIPVHYEGWAHFKESKSEAQRIFTKSTLRCRVLWLDPGIRAAFRP